MMRSVRERYHFLINYLAMNLYYLPIYLGTYYQLLLLLLPTYLLLLLTILSYTYSKKTIAMAFLSFSLTRLFIIYL